MNILAIGAHPDDIEICCAGTLAKYKNRINIENIIEGIPSEFIIEIPRRVRTSYNGIFSRCEWFLEFNLDIALAFDEKVILPIKIYQWAY